MWRDAQQLVQNSNCPRPMLGFELWADQAMTICSRPFLLAAVDEMASLLRAGPRMNVSTLIPSPGSREWWASFSPCPTQGEKESVQTSSGQTPGHQKVWWHIPCSYNQYTLTKCTLPPYLQGHTSLPQSSLHSFGPGVRDSLAVDQWSNKRGKMSSFL